MSRGLRITSVGLVLGALAAVACNPVLSSERDALGGEEPGVRQGPLHRPGQPCLVCHDGQIGEPKAFSVAGTVFDDPTDLRGDDSVQVVLTDADGGIYTATTNQAGNFYITPDQWSPTFPLTVAISGARYVAMQSDIGRSGACATCHVSPASRTSPGPVVMALDDGGAPP